MISKNSKIYIAGHNGMVGRSCWKELSKAGYKNLIGEKSNDLDLTNQVEVFNYLNIQKPDVIINAAAKVGGILENNSYPYDFLIKNMLIQNNLIMYANDLNIKKFIFLGSSCIYPKLSPQPIKEEYLLSGKLEPTNQWYAIAKISGVKLIESIRKQFKKDFISLMPTNLFGKNDNFNLKSSHVLPALIRKFHEAKLNNDKKVILWGSGKPKREFLYVDDLANAIRFSLENKLTESIYNVGSGLDISIKDLAELIKNIVDFKGKIIWDESKPDGTPRKLLNITKLQNLGWEYKHDFKKSIVKTYQWYIKNSK